MSKVAAYQVSLTRNEKFVQIKVKSEYIRIIIIYVI